MPMRAKTSPPKTANIMPWLAARSAASCILAPKRREIREFNPTPVPMATAMIRNVENTNDILWIDVRTLIEYVTAGDDTSTIHVDVSADHKVTANVINGSIGNDQLSTEVKKRISDLEGLVGSTSVQSQINSALSWIDF